MKTMQVARIYSYGDPEVFRVEDAPLPRCGPRDVLVKVAATSVNPVDWKMRRGYHRVIIPRRMPTVLGMDLSGEVVEVGSKVTGFKVGEEVYSSPSHRREGTYAGYVAVRADEVARKPANLDHAEAASLPLVALTAWEALVNAAQLKKGERVLIEAGAGGVGSVAIQLARHLGATIATTCSPRNEALARELGAELVVNYQSQRFDEVLEPQDLVLEMMGGQSLEMALRVLRPGGRLATIHGGLEPRVERLGALLGSAAAGLHMARVWVMARLRHKVKLFHVVRPASGADLAKITALVEAGAIRPLVEKVYPLAQIAQAHRDSESGRTRGKIVIDLS